MTTNPNLQLILYKILHRTHLTGHKMQKMGLSSSGNCPHCSLNCTDTYIHAFWHCIPVYHFWRNITETLSLILGCHIPLSPSLCLLGDLSTLKLDETHNRSLLVALTIARKTILMNWKSRNSIHIRHWKNLLTDYISLENTNSSDNNHNPTWLSFTTFLQS